MMEPFKNKAARAAWIYYQLRLKETTAAAVGRKLRPSVSKAVMSYVITDEKVGLSAALIERVRRAVARAVGAGFGELWGDGAIVKRSAGETPAPPDACATGDAYATQGAQSAKGG